MPFSVLSPFQLEFDGSNLVNSMDTMIDLGSLRVAEGSLINGAIMGPWTLASS